LTSKNNFLKKPSNSRTNTNSYIKNYTKNPNRTNYYILGKNNFDVQNCLTFKSPLNRKKDVVKLKENLPEKVFRSLEYNSNFFTKHVTRNSLSHKYLLPQTSSKITPFSNKPKKFIVNYISYLGNQRDRLFTTLYTNNGTELT